LTTSRGRSFTYFKEAYPAPKSSRAILIPLFFSFVRKSLALFVSVNSAVSVTSKPNSPLLISKLSTKLESLKEIIKLPSKVFRMKFMKNALLLIFKIIFLFL